MDRLYERSTWQEVQAAIDRKAGIVLPLGAIEQHGPHMPVDSDAFFAQHLALAGSTHHDVLVGPSVSFGYRSRPLTGGGPTFPGTVSLSGATYTGLVTDVLTSLLDAGFRRALLYSWHSENHNFIYEAAYLACANRRDVKVIVMEAPFADLSAQTMALLYGNAFPGWASEHAGILETSLMLHMRPQAVRHDMIVDDGPSANPPYDILPVPTRIVAPSGVLHRATEASLEKGRAAFEEIARHLRDVLDTEFPELRLPAPNDQGSE